MKGNFEINGEYRVMENTELVYILTNSERMAGKVREKEMRTDASFTSVVRRNRSTAFRFNAAGMLLKLCSRLLATS